MMNQQGTREPRRLIFSRTVSGLPESLPGLPSHHHVTWGPRVFWFMARVYCIVVNIILAGVFMVLEGLPAVEAKEIITELASSK